jgi:signal recognition particle receptor subunit beta
VAFINYATREINLKIVYYGPGLGGKTTNLKYIYSKLDTRARSRLITIATELDRTLFFDFLQVDLGTVKGFTTRFHLYTVPGQVHYNETRRITLRGADGLIFVADSQRERRDENLESFHNLKENLKTYNLGLEQLLYVMQYNKRDLPNIMPVDELQQALNPEGFPYFEAVATVGVGVFETLKDICKMVLRRI